MGNRKIRMISLPPEVDDKINTLFKYRQFSDFVSKKILEYEKETSIQVKQENLETAKKALEIAIKSLRRHPNDYAANSWAVDITKYGIPITKEELLKKVNEI
jgi:hypothetical protein